MYEQRYGRWRKYSQLIQTCLVPAMRKSGEGYRASDIILPHLLAMLDRSSTGQERQRRGHVSNIVIKFHTRNQVEAALLAQRIQIE